MLSVSKPMATMASKKRNQAVLLLLGLVLVYCAFRVAVVAHAGGFFPVASLRFELLEHGGYADLNFSPALEFGLLRDGCKIESKVGRIEANGTGTVNFPTELQANGYFFRVREETIRKPMRWKIVAGPANSTEFNTVGASVWRINDDGTINYFPQLPYVQSDGIHWFKVTEQANGEVEVGINMAPPLQWSVAYLAMYGMNAALTFVSFTAAVLRKEMTVKWITAVQYALAVGIEIFSSISYSMVGDQRECFSMILWIPADFAFASCLILFESQLVKILLLYSGLCFITGAIRESLYVFDPLHSLFRVLQSVVTIALLVACSIQVLRWRALNNARRLVCKDQASYSVVWAALIAQPQNLVCLSKLKQEVELLQSGLITSPPKQISTYAPSLSKQSKQESWVLQQAFRTLNVPRSYFASNENQYVDNLDQLYAQATFLNPVLIDKTKEWAGLSKGLLLTSNQHGTKRWLSTEDLELESKTKRSNTSNRCNIKTVHRAVEKAVRSYGQVISRLVDICRQCICFESVQDLTSCLKTIAADREVHIVRIKNRLDLLFDEEMSAGYRDLALNLRISTECTRSLGLEGHVCELQLILKSFSEVKSEDGHRHYVTFRNLRGE